MSRLPGTVIACTLAMAILGASHDALGVCAAESQPRSDRTCPRLGQPAQPAVPAEGAPFPAGYRHWTVVKGRLVSAASPSFAKGGGFRYIYANRIERNAEGHGFADGTILVDERVEATADDAGVFQEGRTIQVGVMVKDSSRCAETGGWCFNFFTGSDRTAGIPSEAQKACFTQCHSRRAETDFVFSTFRNP